MSLAGHLFHLGETQLGIKADKLQCHALTTLPPPSMHTYPLPTHLQLYFTQIELLAAIFLMTSLTCSLVVVTCLSLKLKHPYQIFLLAFCVVFLVLTVLSCRGQCWVSIPGVITDLQHCTCTCNIFCMQYFDGEIGGHLLSESVWFPAFGPGTGTCMVCMTTPLSCS